MRNTGTWLVLAVLALAPGAQAQTLEDARGFVAGLYRAYARSPEPDYLGSRARTIFSPRLLSLIRRDEQSAKGDVGVLDGDPICDCQDPDGIRLVGLDVGPAGPGRAIARVRVHFAGERAEAMTLDLVSIRGRWRIDDVHTPDTPSLVRLLEMGAG